MREHGKVWNALAAQWDSLEAMYREELPQKTAPKLYSRMTEIIDAARKESTR